VLITTCDEQFTMPEVESIPAKETVTVELFQPFMFGIGDGAPITTGIVVSRLIVTLCVVVPLSLVATQVRVKPEVSVLMVVAPHPVWLVIGNC
jgi:hypothetical protein